MSKDQVKVAQNHDPKRPGQVARLPHERDESSDSQESAHATAHQVGHRAYDDLQAGRVDTDRSPVYDRMRNDPSSPMHVPSPREGKAP